MRVSISPRSRWTPEKAYLLGLLSSRGAWGRVGKGRRALEVASADLPLLYWLKTALNARARVRRRNGLYRLRLTNQRLLGALESSGAASGLPRLVEGMPPDRLAHFTRGYFDSRGKVSLVRTGGVLHLRTFLPGSLQDTASLGEGLRRHARVGGTLRARGASRVLVLDSSDSLKLHDWMYRAACFYLEAKKSVFERYLAHRALQRAAA